MALFELTHEEVQTTNGEDQEKEEQDQDGVFEHRNGLHGRLHDTLKALDIVDEAQRPQYTESAQTTEWRSSATADNLHVSCCDADKIKLAPHALQIRVLAKYEALREDAKEHLHSVDDVERQVDVFLNFCLFSLRVRLGQSDTVEANYYDDETLKIFAGRDHHCSVTDMDTEFQDLFPKVQALVSISHAVSAL